MKILIVSWHFPPANAMGAVRLGKLARFLADRGHEVRAITAHNSSVDQSLPRFDPERVFVARSPDINALPKALQEFRKSWRREAGPGKNPIEPDATVEKNGGILRWLSQIYVAATNLPDHHIGWLPFALQAVRRATRRWSPDLLYASGPPFTSMLVASLASRWAGKPWVAELRDRWVDDPYLAVSDRRRRFLDRIERHTLSTATGLVTVTEPWAEFYRLKYRKPTATIYNGYDPSDLKHADDSEPFDDQASLRILHTGTIYLGHRDPTPLFAAISLLGDLRSCVRIYFYGAYVEQVRSIAERLGVSGQVETHDPVPYERALQLQRASDVLLLMQWNHPREQGNCPAKLFEYIGALRPVLGIGLEDGVPARIIRERNAGFFGNDPRAIAAQLRRWIEEKDRTGRTLELPERCRRGLTRDEQFEKLLPFLEEAARSPLR